MFQGEADYADLEIILGSTVSQRINKQPLYWVHISWGIEEIILSPQIPPLRLV